MLWLDRRPLAGAEVGRKRGRAHVDLLEEQWEPVGFREPAQPVAAALRPDDVFRDREASTNGRGTATAPRPARRRGWASQTGRCRRDRSDECRAHRDRSSPRRRTARSRSAARIRAPSRVRETRPRRAAPTITSVGVETLGDPLERVGNAMERGEQLGLVLCRAGVDDRLLGHEVAAQRFERGREVVAHPFELAVQGRFQRIPEAALRRAASSPVGRAGHPVHRRAPAPTSTARERTATAVGDWDAATPSRPTRLAPPLRGARPRSGTAPWSRCRRPDSRPARS